MYRAAGAGFSSGNRKGCLKGTRKGVLLRIEEWLMDEKDQRICWLNGLAGTGKTTVAQTFAETTFAEGKLGASFFCSRDFEERSNLQAIFPTLAFQLAHRYPRFRQQLVQVLKASPDIDRDSLNSQFESLIVRPLKETEIPTLIIIDALDECKDEETASALLSELSHHVREIPEVKFFITGRPEPQIRDGFRLKYISPITNVLELHNVEYSSVDSDIRLYLQTKFNGIRESRQNCEFPEEWPNPNDTDILCKRAAGFFIYASTLIKFVSSKLHLPTERLDQIISRSQVAEHEAGIDFLYAQILDLAFRDVDSREQEIYSHFRIVVGAVLLAFRPISKETLSDLLGNRVIPSHTNVILDTLHSLLYIPDSKRDPIRIFHKSFSDFLTCRSRCQDDRFFIDPPAHHEHTLFSCINLMEKRLKKNVCDLDDYAVLSEVKDLPARRKSYLGDSLEYACRFWTRHLASIPGNSPHVKRVQETIDKFFAAYLLRWIEVLSITGHLAAAPYAINEIRQWYTSVSHA